MLSEYFEKSHVAEHKATFIPQILSKKRHEISVNLTLLMNTAHLYTTNLNQNITKLTHKLHVLEMFE